MQAATDAEEPRKLNISGSECLSVAELETVPLKKRLEILFISSIIPSRRQIASKYGLDEQLIHNVLSHRSYILQNWKYNANTEHLLTKSELENAMAFMELLIEWKRRVQLNGLQMTHAALLRKTLSLQKMLKAKFQLTDHWWQLFNENWEHKKFRDNENDSLEFEDILNDLQWMFTESTFNRLAVRLRRARSGGRKRIKRETTKGEGDGLCIDDEEDSSELLDELLDVSEIKAEPLYYNDDDFDCEDYEYVLDEELVFDSLRRELADAETAKYQRFMGIDNTEHMLEAEEDKTEEAEAEFVEEFEVTKSENFDEVDDEEIETKTDIVFDELQENSNFYTSPNIPPDSMNPRWPMIDCKVPVPIRLEIVNPVLNPIVAETTEITPKPFRRKPRNVHAVLTVRKDCVRLPTPTEVANLATKKFVPQEIGEDTNESEENDELSAQKPIRKRKNQIKSIQLEETNISRSPSPQVSSVFEDVHDEQITNVAEPLIMPLASSDVPTIEMSIISKKSDLQQFSCLLKGEQVTAKAMPTTIGKTQQIKDITRRSNRKNEAKSFQVVEANNEGELILGIHSSMGQTEISLPVASTSSQAIGERRKQKFKNKLKITSVQILDITNSRHNEATIGKKSQMQNIEKQKVATEKSSSQKSPIKNTVKRVKRRTDDSDLTLRRDKVRIIQATEAVANKLGERISN